MKFKLGPLASDIFITVYLAVTLYFRFQFETGKDISPLHSVVIGLSFIVIIWALIKLKILNPNWFGLFKNKQS
ncbi:MAG: hypothetical protein ACWA41_01530 [Putridiphycobacter sp.]